MFSTLIGEQIYKPSSVLDNHLSRRSVTNTFKRPTTGGYEQHPFYTLTWSCSRWGLQSHIVAYALVSSYLAFPSLPLRKEAVYFCCTFLGVASTGGYPAPCSTELGLSSCRSIRLSDLLYHII